jgi:microcystin-dependent protein
MLLAFALRATDHGDEGGVGMEPFLGEIRLVPSTFALRGWALCAGQLLPINQNQALFSLLGTTYGGNGRTTFALPDLRGRVPLGAGEAATGSRYALGSTGGHEMVRLTASQVPAHAHAVRASSGAATTAEPSDAFPAHGGAYAAMRDAKMSAAMLARSGGGRAHENRQPYVALNYIIALQGIYLHNHDATRTVAPACAHHAQRLFVTDGDGDAALIVYVRKGKAKRGNGAHG